ncbi:MAG TPA: type II toxin-antitoxin system VapC family toxin [Verrucomicrobiae bacterium]|jgi:ribonuclease VapC|nr:type II toxin-antitoxin system VapC family toxin [Verrucomicrobiae bacterium]
MSKAVLDASALMALLNQEPGISYITPEILAEAVSSTVNLAEVQAKFVDRGIPPDRAWRATLSVVQEVIPFTANHAKLAGDLILHTRPLGLSLGDRACLALAVDLKAPVYTADRSWKKLDVGVRIHTIR